MTIPQEEFRPNPPRPGARVWPSGPPRVIASRGRGHIVVVFPCVVGAKGYSMVSMGVWWPTEDGHHAPDPRKCCLFHLAEVPALIQALKSLAGSGGSMEDAKAHPRSLQDRALSFLASGLGPQDLPGKLWPGEPLNPRRLTELGKALRRAGLLTPGDWILTSKGEDRTRSLTPGSPRFPPRAPEEVA